MLTFNEVIERIGNGGCIDISDVPARVQRRNVWMQSNYVPGYLPDNLCVVATKKDAVATAVTIADNGDGPPRGMITALIAPGNCNWFDVDGYRYKVEQMTIGEML